jgi:hypothetical protein
MENPMNPNERDEAKTRPLFILVSMWLTFFAQRLILHHSSPDTHVFIAGYLVHHLFSGVLVLIPVAFLFALGIRTPRRRNLGRVVLGFASAMVLDEVVYLVCTDGSGVAYRSFISLWGAVILMSIASIFVISVHCLSQRCLHTSDNASNPASRSASERTIGSQ